MSFRRPHASTETASAEQQRLTRLLTDATGRRLADTQLGQEPALLRANVEAFAVDGGPKDLYFKVTLKLKIQ